MLHFLPFHAVITQKIVQILEKKEREGEEERENA